MVLICHFLMLSETLGVESTALAASAGFRLTQPPPEADLIAKFKAASSNQSNGSFSASHTQAPALPPSNVGPGK